MKHLELALISLEKILPLISKGNVLDVGCRDASLKDWFQDRGFQWFGCDSQTGIKIENAMNQQSGTILNCFMEQLPYKPDMFDFLFVCHSLEHCENPSAALREFKKVLKPNGYIFVVMPIVCDHHILYKDEDHISVLLPSQMERLSKYTGLSFVLHFVERNEDYKESRDYDNQVFLIKKHGVYS